MTPPAPTVDELPPQLRLSDAMACIFEHARYKTVPHSHKLRKAGHRPQAFRRGVARFGGCCAGSTSPGGGSGDAAAGGRVNGSRSHQAHRVTGQTTAASRSVAVSVGTFCLHRGTSSCNKLLTHIVTVTCTCKLRFDFAQQGRQEDSKVSFHCSGMAVDSCIIWA